MWDIVFSPGNLSHNLLATGVAAVQAVYYGFRLKSKLWINTSLFVLVGCNLGIILIPYLYGFSLFGDSSRHLIWVEETINGETSLLGSYYLSWYAISVFLVKYLHFQLNWLMVVYPVVTYTVFIFGFYLLAKAVGKTRSEKWVVFLPAATFLFGLGNLGIVPYYFGVMLVPTLIALQFMLADKFRPGLVRLSLILFGVICFSHPYNFLFCSIFIGAFWLLKKNRCQRYFLGFGAILAVALVYFAFAQNYDRLLEILVATFLGGTPIFSVWGNAPYAIILYIPQVSLILMGILASVYFLRRKEYPSVIVLFLVGLNIGIWSISGVFLLRGFTRMFAYALIMGLLLLGLLLRELLFTKPRVAKCLFVYIVVFYFLCALGVEKRFPLLYLRAMRFD